MTLFRVEHNKNYTVINNTICTDKRLSWRAKGIWLYAFSRPNDWQFYAADLVNQSTDGRDSVRAALKELEECGYLVRTQEQGEDGKFKKLEYVFYETPQDIQIILPQTEKPSTVFPSPANRPLLSTEVKPSIEKQQQAAAVFECLKNLQMPESEKTWLSEHYQEADLIKAIAWATAPTTKITKTLEQALKWYLKQQIKPVVGETDEQRAHKLRKFSCDLESKISSSEARYLALTDHTEIITTTTTICFDYNDRDFAERQAKALAKYGFVKVK